MDKNTIIERDMMIYEKNKFKSMQIVDSYDRFRLIKQSKIQIYIWYQKRMGKQIDALLEKIKSWNTNLQYFKKLIDRDDCKDLFSNVESQKVKLEKTMDNINQLSIQIKKLFESSNNWSHADKVKAKKFEKDFINKMQVYTNLLGDYRERKATQLSSFRNSLTQRRSTTQVPQRKQKKNYDQEEQSEHAPQIQLQDVNQETLFQEHMIHLKQKQLIEVKNKMEQALKVQKEVGKLVKQQGEKIDLVEDNVDTARSNVKQAGNLLEQGVQHHKSATKKKMCIIAIIFIALCVIIIPIIIKFV